MEENINQQVPSISPPGKNAPSDGKVTNPKSNLIVIIVMICALAIVGIIAYSLGIQRGQATIKKYPSLTTLMQLTPAPSQIPDNNPDQIIFQKDEGWGPCPPEGEPCTQNSTLYYSGRLVLTGNENSEKKLSQDLVDQVIIKIKQSGIMNKSCEGPVILDYFVTYKIYLDGQEKIIKYTDTGCEKELKEIEKLFL